jgi:uncharacterized membrane protein
MNGLIREIGGFHPALVHFPVALVLTALVAEALYMGRKAEWCAHAARFMLVAAAWLSVPSAVAGFAAAESETIPAALEGAFAIHRIAGVVVPVLAVLACALGEGARRSGQVWEQGLYRVVLLLAAAAVLVAGLYGGELVHGH